LDLLLPDVDGVTLFRRLRFDAGNGERHCQVVRAV
jgi:hypothetical protein